MREQDGTFRRIADGGEFPYLARMIPGLPDTFRVDLDALFEMRLRAMLDRFAGMVEGERPGRRRGRAR